METLSSRQIGLQAEQSACSFLQAQGLQLIERNYRSPYGEIDIIMQDKFDLVFVEVRTRSLNQYGDAIETVNDLKQTKLIKTAIFYLQQHNWLDKVNCRFDIVGFSSNHSGDQIDWVQDAFTTDFFNG